VRTLVISDLHLGQGGGTSVLTRRRPMAALARALDQHDRLVLLGDIVEMQEAHPEYSMGVAEPVLRAIAERLGPEKELVLVAGNHDHELVRGWVAAQGGDLALENEVPADASAALARVCSYLSATQVSVQYPALWLAPGVWATHGHYMANYLRPVGSWGFHLRRRSEPRPATPAGLEQVTPARLEYAPPPHTPHMRDGLPPQRWIDQHIPPGLSPLSSRLLGHQMLRHSLPAFGASVRALGVQADWVVFGHVHRRGPRERDRAERWRVAASGPRLMNTGSWRYEPVVSHGMDSRSWYWPGGAVSVGEDGVPRCLGLLDGLSEAELLTDG